jgi:hypothetical protein
MGAESEATANATLATMAAAAATASFLNMSSLLADGGREAKGAGASSAVDRRRRLPMGGSPRFRRAVHLIAIRSVRLRREAIEKEFYAGSWPNECPRPSDLLQFLVIRPQIRAGGVHWR